MNFSERLRSVQATTNSLLCVGLDTDARLLPPHLGSSADAVLEFNRQIVEATHDLVSAYKLNLAFYEALGDRGWPMLRNTLELIPRTLLKIGDGKRGDVGNTAEHYARSMFDDLGFDAATVNPYMGHDSVEPFLKNGQKGVFLLALTSNPGSRDFQRLRVAGKPFYEKVVSSAKKWNTGKNIGLVVGATHPKELRRIRQLVPEMPLLIPGIGAQKGNLMSAVRFGCDRKGISALINVSRGVIYASSSRDFAASARKEALRIRDEIRMYQTEFFSS